MFLTAILTIAVMGLLIAGMAIGAILQNKPIKGTCGGLNALGMGTDCEICGGDQAICDTENSQSMPTQNESADLSYDASKSTRA
ncbi:MAG TPA: (Na+)-NQR maturation NqrM [Pseudomonadales bacterium]